MVVALFTEAMWLFNRPRIPSYRLSAPTLRHSPAVDWLLFKISIMLTGISMVVLGHYITCVIYAVHQPDVQRPLLNTMLASLWERRTLNRPSLRLCVVALLSRSQNRL